MSTPPFLRSGRRRAISPRWAGARYAIWGSELSPFALKLRAMMAHADLDYVWLPADGTPLANLRAAAALQLDKWRGTVERFGGMDGLDEYPLVPFLFERGGPIRYDSSALARWIDHAHRPARGRLLPSSPLEGFVARFIDDAFDELGLYLVHHRRWTTSAADNDAGQRLASELAALLPQPVARRLGTRFAERQVRRLPYLFSVAPAGFALDGVAPELTPPSRAGFPPTHALLDQIWARLIDALEALLGRRPFLLGERFTVADASVYGQLGMNLADPSAATEMRARAPRLHDWLCAIRGGAHTQQRGELGYDRVCEPLLEVLRQTFVPLMRQNEAAYRRVASAGGTLFNERAFERGAACYDGELCGQPFRSVVKSFQLRPWRELRAAHAALSGPQRRLVPLDR